MMPWYQFVYFEQKFDTELILSVSSKRIIIMNTPNYICLTVGSRAIKLSRDYFYLAHIFDRSLAFTKEHVLRNVRLR